MVDLIRCINCFWLGYFRVEQARDGGTTYFHPETLPLEIRNKILHEPSTLSPSLGTLLARDRKIACLAETIDSSGQRLSVEPAYDNLVAENDFAVIQHTACEPRKCARFGNSDPNLSFHDVQILQQKRKTDQIALAIQARNRASQNTSLYSKFRQLELGSQLNPQKRGKEFEEWLGNLFSAHGIDCSLNVVNNWEQIDFTANVNNNFCIGEARWLKEPVDTKQVRDFFGKLSDRPPFVIGILVSISDFTIPAIEWISHHIQDRMIIPANRVDIVNIVSGSNSFSEFVQKRLEERLKHPRS